MTIENLLLTIEGSLAIGVAVGLLVGILLPQPKLGCVAFANRRSNTAIARAHTVPD